MHMLSLIYKHKIYAFPHSFMLVLKRCYPCISHFNCQLSKFEDNMKPQNKTFFNQKQPCILSRSHHSLYSVQLVDKRTMIGCKHVETTGIEVVQMGGEPSFLGNNTNFHFQNCVHMHLIPPALVDLIISMSITFKEPSTPPSLYILSSVLLGILM